MNWPWLLLHHKLFYEFILFSFLLLKKVQLNSKSKNKNLSLTHRLPLNAWSIVLCIPIQRSHLSALYPQQVSSKQMKLECSVINSNFRVVPQIQSKNEVLQKYLLKINLSNALKIILIKVIFRALFLFKVSRVY